MEATKTTFTPGPWTPMELIGNRRRLGIVASQPNTDGWKDLIAEVAIAENAEANAHLMAAAPEMYAELGRLAESFGWDETHPAVKLIQKARGE